MPNMTSPDSWSNNPSFGMRVSGISRLGNDVTIRSDGSNWRSVYRCFYGSSYSGTRVIPDYLFRNVEEKYDDVVSIVMEFERPLKITNIRWQNDETKAGSYHTFSISAGPQGGEEELLSQTEYAIGQKVYFDHFIPAEKQRYAFRYTISEVPPNSKGASGRFEPGATMQIEGLW